VTRACLAPVALACGCAASGALAIGPTIDAHQVVRLEGAAGGGMVPDGNGVAALQSASPGVVGVWSIGARVTFAGGTRWSHTQASLGGYIEYLRIGTVDSPWGFHAGISFGVLVAQRPRVMIGLYAGPDRVSRARMVGTNDGCVTEFATDGVDLTLRAHADIEGFHAGDWWQLGAMYVRRWTDLYGNSVCD